MIRLLSSISGGWLRNKHDRFLKWYWPEQWNSFDSAPWRHPWLTVDNLSEMRIYSKKIRDEAAEVAERIKADDKRFSFVGNMANSSYQRIKALENLNFQADLYLHPADTYVMSQPEWEEYSGDLPEGASSLNDLVNSGSDLPDIDHVYRTKITNKWVNIDLMPKYIRLYDYLFWPEYFAYVPLLDQLRTYDALYTVQSPYLAYLSGKPYVATHMGGDIWFECSRGDSLGALQRKAFRSASAITVSNPWSYAFARRYGFKNMIMLPMILDPVQYSPGPATVRQEWIDKTGGSYFVLCTARLDDDYKGSNIMLEGFSKYALNNPGAILVLLGWGSGLDKYKDSLNKYGIADRVLILPPCGKKKLIGYLRSADCMLDQFRIGYFGLTALEAMSVGLPVIMRLEAEQYDAMWDTGVPPVINVDNSNAVARELELLHTNSGYRQDVSSKILEWFSFSATPDSWGECYRNLLVCAAAGHKFSYKSSPLNTPLDAEETQYHQKELSEAPVFPNYR